MYAFFLAWSCLSAGLCMCVCVEMSICRKEDGDVYEDIAQVSPSSVVAVPAAAAASVCVCV